VAFSVMLRVASALLSYGLLLLLVSACCLGPNATGPEIRDLSPLGISVELTGHTGGPSGSGFSFTSGDGSSTIEVTPAVAGAPAATRSPTELLGPVEVQWTRPFSYAGMSGFESRALEYASQRTHWVGALDGPRGPIWIHLSTDTHWVPGPTDGDLGWQTLRDGVRLVP